MKTKIITLMVIAFAKISFGQYQQYIQDITPYLSRPITPNGFFYLNTPNNFQAGSLYQMYRVNTPDLDNDMLLVDTHIDQLAGFTHYKYQQMYKGIPIEGAGCIEHYDRDGSLSFINAKVADSIHSDGRPRIPSEQAIKNLIAKLKVRDKILFAWEDPSWEQQIKTDQGDNTATWYPTAELIYAIDEVNHMGAIISGSRFTLAYKITVTTLLPENHTYLYYIDANTGSILKIRSSHIDVTGDVYGYGNRNLDTDWQGGFIHKYRLLANDNGHDIHTKKWNPSNPAWGDMDEVNMNSTNWGNTYLTETSTHFHVTNSWDYFHNTFGRNGMDGSGTGIRVKTQYNGTNSLNAFYSGNVSPNELTFGHTSSAWDLGMEPAIVGHEFTHGITKYTANLFYEFESGALNESFSDIFGTVIQAQTLDGGTTDWIIGNHIPTVPIEVTRSLINPASRGTHWTGNFDASNNPIYTLGQPGNIGSVNWCNCPDSVDKGGVHINSGVQNRWFQLLSSGSITENVTAIGMTDAARISYLALTSILLSSSEYNDSRDATIQAAIMLFGECSQQHRSTADAWSAVGIFSSYNCTVLSVNELNKDQILIYPNPTSSTLHIVLPQISSNPIKIYDLNGKVVKEFENSELHFQTDVSNLEAGVYLMEFTFGDQQLVRRIIVQK